MNIIISPYSRTLRNGKQNPKNYPHWRAVVTTLKSLDFKITQVGVAGEELLGADEVLFNQPLREIAKLIKSCDTWISVDNFFQHFATLNDKPGVVIFGKSDPKIFGHNININLLGDRKYLRPQQFLIWEQEEFDPECFVDPKLVVAAALLQSRR